MLDPNSRRHLIDALRPPAGFQLDYAVGTTYSLDLVAMLTAPLAFTFFDWEADGAQGRPTADPLALLEALRRHADRITIFCEAGRIAIPGDTQQLFAYLEDSVIEARAPGGGAFHPKLWVLRFAGAEDAIIYRVLCLSRNLTFDRCWDSVLVLEGALPAAGPALASNAPLCAFVGALPAMSARQNLPVALEQRIAQMVGELARVEFDLPPGFQALAFHPLGIPGVAQWPFGKHYDRMLVISPFVSAGRLHQLGQLGSKNILVARLEELQSLSPTALQPYLRVLTLNPDANPEDTDEAADDSIESALVGLHAKLYVADDGENAHIWTGSANATHAAFTANVEFLTQLTGPRRLCGVDAVLGEDREGGPAGLIALLQPFDTSQPATPPDPVQQELDAMVEQARRELAQLALTAHVTPGEDDAQFDLVLRSDTAQRLALPAEIAVRCWPITLAPANAHPLQPDSADLVSFRNLSFEALTSFYAMAVEAVRGSVKSRCAFVLNVPLLGAPENRRERILRSLLQSRDQVLRFLLLLLADDSETLSGLVAATRKSQVAASTDNAGLLGIPLFEALVRALDRDPAKLEHIARIVDDLRKTPEGQQLLPETFDSIWAPIQAAYVGAQQ